MTDEREPALGSADEEAKAWRPKRSPRRRALVWSLAGAGLLLVLVAAAATWIGVRGLEAKDSLDRAESLIGELREVATTDPSRIPDLAERIEHETARARALTSDFVWRAGEAVPFAGPNLAAVRRIAGIVDDVASDAIGPIASVAGTLDIAALKPVEGRIDLAPLADAADAIARADDAISGAATRIEDIDAGETIEVVRAARDRLAGLLDEAAAITSTARVASELLPPMLGADGPRTYLLTFQNNAEVRSLGGNAAALLLASVDDGRVAIVRQASSGDFPRAAEPPIVLDPNVYQLYYADFSRYVQDMAMRPDFPTMAQLAQGWWQRQFGEHVDGVVSLDPVALGYLLDATGPLTLPTGDQLTKDNAVQLLLSDVYERYRDPDDQDAFFAASASLVFDSLTSGSTDPRKLFEALVRAAEEGRFLAWSDRPAEQEILATTPLSGILPTTNDETTTVGVYFNDQSSSKIDYWVETAVDATSDLESDPENPTFTVTWTLTSTLTPEQAQALPPYVLSSWWGADMFRTDVYVLGPVGASLVDSSVQAPGLTNEVLASGIDLGRPLVRLATNLAPGGSTTVSVRFAGVPGKYGPLAVRSTPMVHPTIVTVDGR